MLYDALSFDGTTAHSRERYENAAGMLSHLENVGDILSVALKIHEVSLLKVYGPASKLDQRRELLKDLSPKFYTVGGGGVRRYSDVGQTSQTGDQARLSMVRFIAVDDAGR